ncbi:hypothetical protein QE152_g15976 [Popillia japonica]|uniref:Ribosomal protein L5 n=1 Tax=Popillia japonica TaxID=7064 RepID=A0AAW1L6B5_POPJA
MKRLFYGNTPKQLNRNHAACRVVERFTYNRYVNRSTTSFRLPSRIDLTNGYPLSHGHAGHANYPANADYQGYKPLVRRDLPATIERNKIHVTFELMVNLETGTSHLLKPST